ncbi:hypothetical protein Hanom_Chr09g00774321 [Helianthus anomalus]
MMRLRGTGVDAPLFGHLIVQVFDYSSMQRIGMHTGLKLLKRTITCILCL